MNNTDKDIAGVGGVMTAFAKIGWTLRERGRIDYGIDADVEMKIDGEYQSKHIALQIKSGESFLKMKKNGKISFSIDDWHYKYWLKSDRPVLIVFYDIDNNNIMWEQVCLSNLQLVKKNHIIEIDPSKKLTIDSKTELENIISNYHPFEAFQIESECVNFDYSIHCYCEIITVLDRINTDFADFKNKVNKQSNLKNPNTAILTKLFEDFTKELTLNQELLYEDYCKSHWYIDVLASQLVDFQKKELRDIVDKHKGELSQHIRIWNSNANDYATLNDLNVPPKLQRAANNLIFRIKEYVAILKIIIDTLSSILKKLN